MNTATKAAIACGVAAMIALVVCFLGMQRGPPRQPLANDIKLGCIFGWLMLGGALCFIMAALLQVDD